MDFREVLKIIADAARAKETVEIYYPITENSPEGWRELEPYSLTTDIPPEGEYLVYDQDRLSPGHIFNARIAGSKENGMRSFIVGKIRRARGTGKKFTPPTGWKIRI